MIGEVAGEVGEEVGAGGEVGEEVGGQVGEEVGGQVGEEVNLFSLYHHLLKPLPLTSAFDL